jgi:hypothetical protein
MKILIALLFAVLVSSACPVVAREPDAAPPAPHAESRFLSRNYQATVTFERKNQPPFIVSALIGYRETELALIDPIITLGFSVTQKNTNEFLLVYKIGSRRKMGNDQWADEGVKGGATLTLDQETVIFSDPQLTIRLKLAPLPSGPVRAAGANQSHIDTMTLF